MDALLRRRLMMQQGGGPTPPPTPVPVFYDRLVFDGTAYIETDIMLPEDCSVGVPLGYETLKAAQRIFYAGGNGVVAVFIGSGSNNTYRQLLPYYDSSSYLINNYTLNWTYTTYSLFLTPMRIGVGNNSRTFTKGGNRPTTPLLLGTNSSHSGQPFTGKMGTLSVYGSDAQDVTSFAGLSAFTPVYTLRPCTYNGEPGMWNVEQGKFYGNTAGAGQLSVENT